MIRGENSAADGTSRWSAFRTAAAFLEEFRSGQEAGNSANKAGGYYGLMLIKHTFVEVRIIEHKVGQPQIAGRTENLPTCGSSPHELLNGCGVAVLAHWHRRIKQRTH